MSSTNTTEAVIYIYELGLLPCTRSTELPTVLLKYCCHAHRVRTNREQNKVLTTDIKKALSLHAFENVPKT